MKHNDYEYLLNSIYYQGLKGQGMTAGVYQKMQNEYGNLSVWAAQVGVEGEHAFKRSFFIVRSYVQQAIKDGMANLKLKMQLADITKLTCIVAMLNRNFYDKQSLDVIIATANSVFNQYNLEN